MASPVRCGGAAGSPLIPRPPSPWKGTARVAYGALTTAAVVNNPARRQRKAAAGGTRPAAAVITAKKREIDGATEDMNAIASRNMDFAPALGTLQMAPPGIRMEERYEKNSEGLEIFWKSWLPRHGTPIKGALFFCHGYGDTCTFFFEGVAKRIAAAGYAVYAMDYPGFGLSEGLHGYIPNFDEMVDHVIEQYAFIRALNDIRGLPHFLLGQSMGGAVALKVHLKQPNEWDGVVLVSPMCKITAAEPLPLEIVGGSMGVD
ncbi:hypothetical protein Taro_032363 [Colocasia esculenta]|uniref:Serine aminopeptidase S33 domain-containing protein n=1 Tax=Colocasia esculenta TaxID=4460 RepID=A0A843VL60_COLES|nr:hypothetical protein [Colocasia esculenta]